MEGRIIFTNKKESNVSAAALVFVLKSEIIGRVSEKIWPHSAPLYEISDCPIAITNKFSSAEIANFEITIIPEKFSRSDGGNNNNKKN